MQKYGVPVIVAINKFPTDTAGELELLAEYCRRRGARFALSEVFERGGEGGVALANAVVEACEEPGCFKLLYDEKAPIKEKVETIAREIYGAAGVVYSPAAQKAIAGIEALGKAELPVCVAKTQYSLSDDPKKLGRPQGFELSVKDVRLSAGAGFIVVYTGDIMTMPGLPKVPAAEHIDVDGDGIISGLF